MGRSQKTGRATFIATKEGVVVCNREFIGVVASSGSGFNQLLRLRVNPGSARTFPWLSTMANSWETYRFRKLRFEYIARCPTTTPGSIFISPDYDAQDGAPINEVVQSAIKGTVEDGPWKSLNVDLSPANMNRAFKSHFTMDDARFGNTTQDEKTIDAGQVFLSTETDGAAKLGRLWVSYECELNTPQPPEVDNNLGSRLVDFSAVPTNTGSTFPASVVVTNQEMNVADPIIELLAGQGIDTGVQFARFLRPFSGTLTTIVSGLGSGTINPISGANLTPVLNNIGIPFMPMGTRNGDNGTISTRASSITDKFTAAIGDVLGLPDSVTSAATVSNLRFVLQGLV
jgi:hypothetical protein